MRSKSYLVNDPTTDVTSIGHGMKFLTYIQKDGTEMYQTYHIENDCKQKVRALRVLRDNLSLNTPEFSHWF